MDSGAEPQISAFNFGPMLFRISGNITRLASHSHKESNKRNLVILLPQIPLLCSREYKAAKPPRF